MKRFIGILQFLTRIPIKIETPIDKDFHKSTAYFPLVGLTLGVLYYIIGVLALKGFNAYISTVLILIGEVFLTGGLHLDGVGDTFDGLYSYRDKDRILEIMKDSRLGTNALLAIMFLILLKLGFIYSVLEEGNLWVLILMPVYARMVQVIACYKTRSPREKGMGNLFIGKVTPYSLGIALGSTVIISFLVVSLFNGFHFEMYLKQIIGLLLMSILVRLFIKDVYKKIDGITGDILGCICEFGELGFLIYIYLI